MKKNISFFITIMLCAIVTGCDEYTDGYFDGYDKAYYLTSSDFLTLRNFSSDTTVWFVPDQQYAESLPESLSEWQKIAVYRIAPHSSYILSYNSQDGYVTPEETYGPDDRFTIYVFKSRDWNNISWPELVSGEKWVSKVSLTVEEASAQNNIVSYPMR